MTELAAPADFPSVAEETLGRRLLEAIVSGAAPPPPCVPRFALPRPSAWSPGVLAGSANPSATETWTPGVVFGGYLACLVDQFAGLVMLSVLPDGATFLTAGMQVDMYHPMRPGEAGITARVMRLTGHAALVEVTLEQAGRTTTTATVQQVIRR